MAVAAAKDLIAAWRSNLAPPLVVLAPEQDPKNKQLTNSKQKL